MDLTAATADVYVRWAYRQILDVADRLGDATVNERPPGPDTNTVAHLITHCCGVSEFWLGHIGLGRPSDRDRDSEFATTATVKELHTLVDATVMQITADLKSLDGGRASRRHQAGRQLLQNGDESDASLVLHVLEELYQHLGQMELTADALGAPPRTLD